MEAPLERERGRSGEEGCGQSDGWAARRGGGVGDGKGPTSWWLKYVDVISQLVKICTWTYLRYTWLII